ncbi:MAG: peptidoglycan DD-metalloendopeptidase family protein [Parcubacteria group bacterium]|nr:peptidoglycan DD-metalloendopeptidase family protein [Parcubacteria group bacterium]
MNLTRTITIITLGIVSLSILSLGGVLARADLIEDLKDKISDSESEVAALEAEIAEYQAELAEIGEEKATLANTVETLDITRRKLAADIAVTQEQVSKTKLNITRLSLDIGDTSRDITEKKEAVAHFIRKIDETESLSLAELLLSSDTLSRFWDDVETMRRFEQNMNENVDELVVFKSELEYDKAVVEREQENLISYRSQLSDQKEIADQNRATQNTLLAQTKNQESLFQSKLTEKKAAKEELEKELLEYESQLQFALDPDSVPFVGSGVLAWPLKSVYITQYFGNTPFAQSGAYNGNTHNGIDMRASVGTPVYSSLAGVVEGTGNTDAQPGCYSYGKWVLVRHYNGLSTLYAHLSLIKMEKGQTVSTNDIIGYSGNTGYSTGPHLHYTVYASDAVEIVRLGDIKTRTNCADAYIPVSALSGYMNPLDYLVNGEAYRTTRSI